MEPITVSQVNEYVKMLIDSDGVLSAISVSGEISNFKRNISGHIYFSMKDPGGLIRCVMFARDAYRLTFSPKDGDKVVASGRVSVYPRDGVYQLYVSSIVTSGLGELYAEFERVKKKLGDAGLFDKSRKKPIPAFPKTVGIVTSGTGAALRDMKNVLGRRWPAAEIVFCPAVVQGASAPRSIIDAIDRIENETKADVLIIGRGGGSFEDLSCFNDETLALRVAACKIPVISAVGHETDFVITDFVADLRAPTPSAAAELAVPDRAEMLLRIERLTRGIFGNLKYFIDLKSARIEEIAAKPALSSPGRMLDVYEENLDSLTSRIYYAYKNFVDLSMGRLSSLDASIRALSPLATLSRGYAIIKDESGAAVTSAGALRAGERISLKMSDGEVPANVSAEYDGGNKNG